MNIYNNHITSTLNSLKEQDLLRKLTDNNNSCISFTSNDYLGLSKHPKIIHAAKHALDTYGAGATGSRYTTGNHPLYKKLEAKLASIKETDNCLIFGSGYLTHIGIIPALVGKGDIVIADKLIHASIIDAIKLSGAKLVRFHHNDVEHCQTLLKKHRNQYKHCLIITEHVFSMDGDIAPTTKLYNLANKHNAVLLTDDAHGFGVLPNWSKHQAHIYMGTLSKAIGAYGGYVCADKLFIELFTQKARSAIYTTALPPSIIASAIAALDIIKQEPELMAKPLAHAQYFTNLCNLAPATSAIVPYIVGDAQKAVQVSNQLQNSGYQVAAIRPPTVPHNSARLRFTFCANHTNTQIERLAELL